MLTTESFKLEWAWQKDKLQKAHIMLAMRLTSNNSCKVFVESNRPKTRWTAKKIAKTSRWKETLKEKFDLKNRMKIKNQATIRSKILTKKWALLAANKITNWIKDRIAKKKKAKTKSTEKKTSFSSKLTEKQMKRMTSKQKKMKSQKTNSEILERMTSKRYRVKKRDRIILKAVRSLIRTE